MLSRGFGRIGRRLSILNGARMVTTEVKSWDEAEQQEQMRIRAEELSKRKNRRTPSEYWNDIKSKYNSPSFYLFIGTIAFVVYDVFRTHRRKFITEISPYDDDLYYVQEEDGSIRRFYIKKSVVLDSVTKIELDEDLRMNGNGETRYRDGTVLKFTVQDGVRVGLEEKFYPPGGKLVKSSWENVDDCQKGCKYLYFQKDESNPLAPVIEIFEAEKHLPKGGGYFSQLWTNGDQVESYVGWSGTPQGPARITLANGGVIENIYYENGKLQNLPEEYLLQNAPKKTNTEPIATESSQGNEKSTTENSSRTNNEQSMQKEGHLIIYL